MRAAVLAFLDRLRCTPRSARCGRHRRTRALTRRLIRFAGLAIKFACGVSRSCSCCPSSALPRPVPAQEFVAVPDLISDEAFYRLVACAAPPGRGLRQTVHRWPTERRLRLRVGIAQISEEFAGYRLDLVDRVRRPRHRRDQRRGGASVPGTRLRGAFRRADLPCRRAAGGRDLGHRRRRSRRFFDLDRAGGAAARAVMKSQGRPSRSLATSSGARSRRSCWRNWCRPWGLSPMWFLRLTRIRSFPRTTTRPPVYAGRMPPRSAAIIRASDPIASPIPSARSPRLSHHEGTAPMLDTKTVQDYIRTIPDFPHEGILFRDVTTLFLEPRGFRLAIDQLLEPFVGQRDRQGDRAGGAGVHPRRSGGAPAVERASCRVRKKGKLPGADDRAGLRRWNTAARRWRCMTTRSSRAEGAAGR
jgi:hypothetical protein